MHGHLKFAGTWLAAAALIATSSSAQQPPDEILLKVGSQTVSRSDLQQRLAQFPRADLEKLGKNASDRLHGYLEQVVIPELLLVEAAPRVALEKDAGVRAKRDHALSSVVERELVVQAEPTISKQEVVDYFQANRSKWDVPAAISIWRILVASQSLASEIIGKARGAQGVSRWRELAREHSLDAATKMRGGSLGFVRADGTTDVPQLQVDSALYAAVKDLAEGALVAEPIPEGKRFAVLWRRGSRPGRSAVLAELEASITALLVREKVRTALNALVAELRRVHVRELYPERIELAKYPLPSFTPRDAFPPPVPSGAKLRAPAPADRGYR